MPTKPTDLPLDASQIGSEITAGLSSADDTAAKRAQNLQWVHQARASHLSRTADSLKAQYGTDDPGVKAAEAAAAAANVAAAQASMVHQQLTTVDPEVAQNGWALHGRVYNAQRKPVSGFTVFLADATETYQRAYGFASTDSTGYFLLQYAGPESASQEKSQTVAEAAAPELFIAIANPKGQRVPVSTTPFQPVKGTATYRKIMLPNGDQSIGELPAEIRDVALPSKKKKKV